MNKALFHLASLMTLALVLSAACSDQGSGNTAAIEPAADRALAESDSLMERPVDFSSPEAVEKTMQNIRDQEGETAYKNLKSSMDYILVYDLSLGNDKTKLYKKLDGQTPKQILARMRKR